MDATDAQHDKCVSLLSSRRRMRMSVIRWTIRWTKEEMFSTGSRRKNHAALDSYVESWTSLHTPETVVDLMLIRHSSKCCENSKDLAMILACRP
jgi:hypothetical protein